MKVIIFDVDGTLFDTRNGIIQALNYVLNVYGKTEIKKEDEAKYIGPPIKKSLVEYQGMDESEANEATALYRKIYVESFIKNSEWYVDVEDTLKTLKKQGNILGIATMKTMPQLEELLRVFHCKSLFSILKAAREDESLSKVQMLMDIKKEYPDVNEFVMVGDTLGDFKAAKEAGYDFIAADYGYGNIDKLEEKHIGKFKDLADFE